MAKKYRVTLTPEERVQLEQLVSRGKGDARKLAHARVLLQADEADGGPRRADADVAGALDLSVRTVERVRERFVEAGFEAALVPRPTARTYARRLDGAQEAKLVMVACSDPPAGKNRWTLRLLAGRMVELAFAAAVSHETVRQVLKKTSSSRGSGGCGASRPRRARSSPTTWRTWSACTTGRTTPTGPRSASTRRSAS